MPSNGRTFTADDLIREMGEVQGPPDTDIYEFVLSMPDVLYAAVSLMLELPPAKRGAVAARTFAALHNSLTDRLVLLNRKRLRKATLKQRAKIAGALLAH